MAFPAAAESPGLAAGCDRWPVRAAEAAVRYGLAAFILAIPLEVTTRFTWQPVSRWILVAVAVALGYLVLTGRRALALPGGASVAVLGVYVVASLVSWSATRSPGSVSSVLDVTLYPIAAFVMFNSLTSFDDHRRAWVAFLASGLGVALLGVLLAVTHWHLWTPNAVVASRLNITFADPNITARFLTIAAGAGVLVYAARQGPRWLAVATAVLCAFVLPFTLSRSGLAIFVLTAVLAVVIARDRRRAAALGGVAIAAFVISTLASEATRARAGYAGATLASIFGSPAPGGAGQAATPIIETDSRSYLIRAGIRMFTDHPLAGVGFGGYQHALLTAYHGFLPRGPIDSLSHTAFVTVVAEQGLVGGAIVVAFLLVLGWEVVRALREPGEFAFWVLLPAALILPILAFSQFEGRLFGEPYLWLVLALLYSAVKLRRRERPSAVGRPAARP